ncbi:hypothetical protein B0J12DRAFT_412292 [Macrophomina phaseolina]|uniref:Short-chain dehydrogenase/reductase SDR n=1 Tax=Macrophomina phaseolina TaxID=35725 RepID=A0ABQ8GJV3_9PEZI|nr:hypothetical protein B0J12DRAFT_412292 [Macrophomina phaseolina]
MSAPPPIPARESPPPSAQSTLAKLWWAARNPPADPRVSFAGKTVLVTGANTGLGFQAAVKYAALHASRVLLAVRSADKGEAAKADIVRLARCSADTVRVLPVDLSSFESVQAFVPALRRETDHLDVVLLNAGMANPTFVRSAAGYEMALQVNVLSTALMAVLLLPLLRAAPAPAHLTFVNSIAHADVQPDWCRDSLLQSCNDEAAWNVQRSYGMVKLLAMAVMHALARAAPADQLIVNACCPYMCKTDLGRNWGLAAKIPMAAFQAVFARTAEQGARTLVSATALGPESHGRFWHHDILYPLGDLAKDDEFMQKCWSEVLHVISTVQPDLHDHLGNKA